MSEIKTLCMTTYNRFDLLQRTLDSLIASDIPDDVTLFIYDDASNTPIHEILDAFCRKVWFKVCVRKRTMRLGCNRSVMDGLRETALVTKDPYIFNFDSDAVFRKDWYTTLSRLFHPMYKDTFGALSIFNASRHGAKEEYNSELLIKPTIGGLAALIRSDIINVIPNDEWDWRYCDVAKARGLTLFCTKNSYVDHIGWNKGEHGQNGIGGDRSLNFQPT